MNNVFDLLNSMWMAFMGIYAIFGIISYIKNWTKRKHRSPNDKK